MMSTPIHRFATCCLTLATLLTLPSCVWKTGKMIEDGGKTHWRPFGEWRVPLWMDDQGKYYAELDVIKCRYRHLAPYDASVGYGDTYERWEPLAGEKPQHCWVELKPLIIAEAGDYMLISALLPEKPAHCVRVEDHPERHSGSSYVYVYESEGGYKDSSVYWRVPLAWGSRVAVDAPLTVLNIGGSFVYMAASAVVIVPAKQIQRLAEQPQEQANPCQNQPEQIAEKSHGAETNE